jgi:cytochrome P450
LAGFELLLNSPGNQQMMLSWLGEDGTAGTSPLREQLLQDKAGGWPKKPRKLAVSCGRGDGVGSGKAGARTLDWDGKPLVSATLNTLPGANGVVAEGSWFLSDPPELPPLEVGPETTSWESAPGGQNTYNGQVAAIAGMLGCGRVAHDLDVTCSVPTVSALGLTQDPLAPVPPVADGAGPFDAYVCSEQNVQHLTITPVTSSWLLGELGPPGPDDRFAPTRFDPHDPGFLSDPYPTYARFREERPVFQVKPYGSYWVFRRADVLRVLTEKETFLKNSPLPPAAPPKVGPFGAMAFFPKGLFSSDPPRHDALRAILEPLFKDAIANAEQLVAGFADPILDKARQTGRIELVADYALPVPSSVLFSILGIPDDPKQPTVWPGLVAWITAIVAAHDITQSPAVQQAGGTCAMALQTFVDGLIHQNLKDPLPGLLGAMCKAITDDFTADDVQACFADFLVAGYLSTTFLICTGTRNLLANPEQAQALRKDTTLIDNAVEEMLRFDAPAQLVDRVVKTDTELGGVSLKAGDKVTAVLGSADHDPDAFADPDEFRIDRDDRDQMSFGWGIHHCIGAPLVRLAAPVAIGKLMELDGLAIDGLAQWQTDPYLRGLANLPMRFDT